jgi:hypothetical protein
MAYVAVREVLLRVKEFLTHWLPSLLELVRVAVGSTNFVKL